jgi:uncharacterized protein (TIGR03083 family)
VDKPRYIELLRLDGEALARAAAKDLHAPVPSCPEWDVAALVLHTGQVHRHKTAILRHASLEYPKGLEAEPGPGDEGALVDWYLEGFGHLVDVLEEADPHDPVWSWGSDQHVAFWLRRMTQETAVHRWDAEAAVAEPEPIERDLAVDGIEEMLSEFIPGEGIAYAGKPGDLSLQCTDVGAGWTIHLKAGKVPTHNARTGPGNATIRGEASDLLLLLWRRKGIEDVKVSGKAPLATDFWTYLEGPGQ